MGHIFEQRTAKKGTKVEKIIPSFEIYLLLKPLQRRSIRKLQRSLGQKPYHARLGVPHPLKGKERPNLRGPRAKMPHVWKSGPDIDRHNKYYYWAMHRSQALFRAEEYLLSFDDFVNLWGDQWNQRGRKSYSLILTRKDMEGAWSVSNCHLMERLQHIRLMAKYKKLKRS